MVSRTWNTVRSSAQENSHIQTKNITEELGLTKEQANAIANIVVILEKNNPNTILTN